VTARDPDPCPCGSGSAYAACCGPLHADPAAASARTAEALMRSRYTAFGLGLADYLLATWHPSTRPPRLQLDPAITWRRLQIVDTVDGGVDDETGIVEFRAAYRAPDGGGLLEERSRFARDAGAWRYVDGDVR
jgi:SEC-C motif domain protein